MYTLFVILIVLAAVLMIGIVLMASCSSRSLREAVFLQALPLTTKSAVFARPQTSSRRLLGDLQLLWLSSALYAHGLHLPLLPTVPLWRTSRIP